MVFVETFINQIRKLANWIAHPIFELDVNFYDI